jgi:GH25 family lysozyme M1 (1,4-beta-N-acetylmuramidase)
MLTRNKIGFHVGPDAPGSNLTGIGNWMRQLHAAGIPMVLKSVDNYGPIYEADKIVDPNNTVDHTFVFRLSDSDFYSFDTPPYKDPQYINDPEGGAVLHWNMTKQKLPPEFNKERVWLELTNEVDRNLCTWLDEFALKIAQLANAEGYKVALFGWAGGEPEPQGWEEMLDFLRYCGDNRDKCAIAIHEYSFIVTDIFDQWPFKVGRFQYLFAICDKFGINRPTTLITEWGWTLNDAPGSTTALIDIEAVSNVYNQYDNILGAAIWYLGPGFNIADKVQKLIQPVTDWTINSFVEIDEINPPIDELPSINGWEQYMETSKIAVDVTVEIEDKETFIGLVRGIGSANATGAQYRWLYNDGTYNVYTDWVGLSASSIPQLDIRGLEFLVSTSRMLTKTVPVEIECPNPNPLPVVEFPLVVDYSHWQGATNHVALKTAGVYKFMSKITEHTVYVDTEFLSRYQNAVAAGYKKEDIAPYHFYRFNKSPVDQANHFVNTYKSLVGNPACAFVADVEDVDNTAVGKQGELKLFLDIVEYLTGFKPIIYTGSWWWTAARWGGAVPWAKNYAMVEAEYPLDPVNDFVDFNAAHNWTKTHSPALSSDFTIHSFWQFTSKANGIAFGVSSKYLDVQSFNGNLDELRAVYTKKGTVLTDPRPNTNKIDMLQYIRGQNGIQYEMRFPNGNQERYQVQWDVANPQIWYIVKGENQGHYERWSYDDNYIYLEMDTSPANAPDGQAVYYTIDKNGRSPKYRRFMSVGEVFNDGGHVVTFRNVSNCAINTSDPRSGNAANNTTFIRGAYTDTFYNNIVLTDVIECLENTEGQFWGKGFGRVRWQSTWGEAEISEIHSPGSRPDVLRQHITCLGQ